MAATSYPSHFSQPWKLSDVVLVVEDQRFHVHRGTLAFWSPVFERMFTTDFKEKDSDEISLTGKKAGEFEEMLQMMYPSLEEKQITQRNCYFLFELAHEYQIDSIAQKCVNLMVSMVKRRKENDVLGMLIYAQTYEIKSLISTCIYEGRRLTLQELKKHGKRDQIEPDNYLQIAEGIIERLEVTSQNLCQLRYACRSTLEEVSPILYRHGLSKGSVSYGQSPAPRNTTQYLSCLTYDVRMAKGPCDSLSSVASRLLELNSKLESLPLT